MFHVVMGLPGTGKTIAAMFLAQKLPARLMRLDDVYVRMFPHKEAHLTNDEGVRRLDAAYHKMGAIIRKAPARYPKKHFVLEAVFRSVEQRKVVMEAIVETRERVSLLLLTAQREITRDRIQLRQAAGISTCSVRTYERARAEFQDIRMPPT